MTDQQIDKLNRLYKKACDKMNGLVIVGRYRPKTTTLFERWRAKKAIKYFKKILSIYPYNWQCEFFIGKLYQRLGEYSKSVLHFEKASNLDQTIEVILQEASLVAMHLNEIDKSLEYSRKALTIKPDDIAILGNHSMLLLVAGFDNEARETINKAIRIDPNDGPLKTAKARIEAVISGKINRPTFESSL